MVTEVKGINEVKSAFRKKGLSYDKLDDISENSMKRIQLSAFKKGPVLTGYLTSNMVADENRRKISTSDKVEYQLIDGTKYTLVQEFGHRYKSDFIRSSVETERPKFYRAVEKWAKEE